MSTIVVDEHCRMLQERREEPVKALTRGGEVRDYSRAVNQIVRRVAARLDMNELLASLPPEAKGRTERSQRSVWAEARLKYTLQHSSVCVVEGPDGRGYYTAVCPFHGDGQGEPTLKISTDGFNCCVCGAKGGLFKLARRLRRLDMR